jgi:hypothetical protein
MELGSTAFRCVVSLECLEGTNNFNGIVFGELPHSGGVNQIRLY